MREFRSLAIVACVAAGAAHCKTPANNGSQTASASASNPDAPVAAGQGTDPAGWASLEGTIYTADSFNMAAFPLSQVLQYMVPGSDALQTPPALQGIWWMDGNPTEVGDLLSFAKGIWDLPNHRMLFQEYGPNNMTYNGDSKGTATFVSTASENLCETVQFNSDYSFGQYYQTNRVPGTSIALKVPLAVVNYQMTLVADGDYLRASWWGPARMPDYHMRRIFDGQGNPVHPAYDNWLKIAPASFIMPMSYKTAN